MNAWQALIGRMMQQRNRGGLGGLGGRGLGMWGGQVNPGPQSMTKLSPPSLGTMPDSTYRYVYGDPKPMGSTEQHLALQPSQGISYLFGQPLQTGPQLPVQQPAQPLYQNPYGGLPNILKGFFGR